MTNKQKSSPEAASTDLVATSTNSLSSEQIELIKATVAKGATDEELKLFLYTATRTGLDPLTRQIYFQKRQQRQRDGSYKDVMTILTGIDGYRAIADRTGQLAGIEDPVYEEIETQPYPRKATVTIYKIVRSNRVPFTASARWAEYAPQGSQAFMWQKMPYLMLGKVAEALALRKAFPLNLSGLYTTEEMDQAPAPIVHEETKELPDISPENARALEDKKKIAQLCKKLKIDMDESMIAKIRGITGLDVRERANYGDIITRLETVIKESKK